MSDHVGRVQCRRWRPGQDINGTLNCPSAARDTYGSGQPNDPEIIWTCDTHKLRLERGDEYIEAHNRIAREVAMLSNFRLVVIRANCHNIFLATKPGTKNRVPIPADPHMTIYMGNDWEHLQVQGYIFLRLDKNAFPIGVATPQDRRIVRPGDRRTGIDLWDFAGHGGATTASNGIQASFSCQGRVALASFQAASDETKKKNHSYHPNPGRAPTYHSSQSKIDSINQATNWRRTDAQQIRSPKDQLDLDNFVAPKIAHGKKPSPLREGQGFATIGESDCP